MARSVLTLASAWSRKYSATRSRLGRMHIAAMAETFCCERPRWRSTGVCPRRLAARGCTGGAMSIPDSSRKTMAALRRAAFFLLEASLARSRHGSLLIALDSAPRGLLR